mgnify:CR=1 FL=1
MNQNSKGSGFCPNCGAPSIGSPFCPHCGSSMNTNGNSTDKGGTDSFTSLDTSNRYDVFAEEDSAWKSLPTVKCHNVGSSKFVIFFCLIFGLCFSWVPFFIFFLYQSDSSSLPLADALVLGISFGVVGFSAIVILLVHFYYKYKSNSGENVYGVLRSYAPSNTYYNGIPLLNMFIEANVDGQNVLLILNSGKTLITMPIGSNITLIHYKKYYKIIEC